MILFFIGLLFIMTRVCLACERDEVECWDGTCIYDYWVCDGWYDCASGEDEVDCGTCYSDEYECFYDGTCIPDYWECDGYPDCYYGEDEDYCSSCYSDEF